MAVKWHFPAAHKPSSCMSLRRISMGIFSFSKKPKCKRLLSVTASKRQQEHLRSGEENVVLFHRKTNSGKWKNNNRKLAVGLETPPNSPEPEVSVGFLSPSRMGLQAKNCTAPGVSGRVLPDSFASGSSLHNCGFSEM